VPWSNTPPGVNCTSPCRGAVTVAFRSHNALGTRNEIVFVAACPTAHTLARLRFAGGVADTVARLATDPGGLPLVGRVSHPLDDKRNFIESSHILDSFPTSRAWSQLWLLRSRRATSPTLSYAADERGQALLASLRGGPMTPSRARAARTALNDVLLLQT